ncbi:MAG TPA: HipA N-terminal domain-containing protein [Saprospiraceae bacterium]|nr:HipA N-terminal domain-containing protein [Saprospiraceae bacterium]HMQ81558.1 HipA N-terminal domain-containing protein [Saprospiraceae bacterium]
MISKLIRLWKSEGQENIIAPQEYDVDFHLTYKDLKVGTLSLHGGIWTFKYSEEFKKQDQIKPLIDFPDVERDYCSDELYPFFAHRIPGLGQPKVKKIIKDEKIDAQNEAKMLERFGKVSIANPFHLRVV